MTNWLTDRWRHAMPLGGIKDFGNVLWDSWKLIVVLFCFVNVGTVSVLICGHLGKIELDGVSLAVSTINVMVISIGWGVGSAFDTFFSQAFGSPNKKQVGVYLQSGLIFFAFVGLFSLTIFTNSYNILIAVGQDSRVAMVAEEYLYYFSPGIVCVLVFMILSKYLQSQKIVNPFVIVEVISFLFNILLQYLLVYVAGMGVRGSAIAHACCFALMLTMVLCYLLYSGVYNETWSAWTLDCLEDWGKISRLVFAALCLVCIDWWGIEIGIFLIGTVGTVPLGAAGIHFQLFWILISLAQGTSIQWVYRIGRYLGQCDADSARRYTNAAILVTMVISVLLMIIMLSFRTLVPRLFTSNTEIIQLAIELFPYAALFMCADSIKTQLSGVIRGIGKQRQAAVVAFVTLSVLTFAIAVPATLYTDLGSLGFWTGVNIGGFLCAIAFMIMLLKIDWAKEVQNTADRIRQKKMLAEQDATESQMLLADKAKSRPRRNRCYLISTRLLIATPFIIMFALSVVFRVISPPYDDTNTQLNISLISI